MHPSLSARPFPRVLTIAGSDSGGGAGIQADLKTISALGAYGASVITAITAQNTVGVQAVEAMSPSLIRAQCESVFSDIHINAVKIGMLPDVASISVVAEVLQQHQPSFVVLDPVLIATSGDLLALEDTITAMIALLLPLADVITPNLSELATLTQQSVAGTELIMRKQGEVLMNAGAKAVLLKGGHWDNQDEAIDWLLTRDLDPQCFCSPRVHTHHTHGTGCTLSSAIAALRPQHHDLSSAVGAAKSYVHNAIDASQYWHLGHGSGPLAHFWRFFSD
ncbi:bifunctional hydroxymethylpyrimidine kinase/phosphomethylpyrimidine kinase [Snodgrassella sp. CFCC 13594]|uniref:bifunctional hydroxymethylpyrimidine kinase/phosphomethylpyrimidine kinase n=1 Tax=Snodgrassella sp. CFCC 13594 TaxID=1775559 RepID=UPI00082A3F02|nr:bifunctional hydroxymethylpyrimidine kinase/phosphomethylpyrimidine kinase [Snodgrassella sp. CFCC 13594]